MGNLIDDVNDVMNSLREYLRLIIIIGIAIFILWAFSDVYFDNQSVIHQSITEICGIDQKLFDALDDTVFETLDKKGRIIWNQFHQGSDVSKCDAVYFFEQLDEKNRKKIILKELTCNINDCLNK